jgi:hypothetical protein
MAGPITWRNIQGDTTGGVASLMEVARRSFNDGIGNFQGVLDTHNKTRDANWEVQKQNNTDQFLDRLTQFRTPEELAAAQQAGQLDALKAQFGGQIDRDAVRGAESKQADVLMQRIAAQNQYSDDTRRRSERDQMDVGRNFILGGDYAGFKKWASEVNLMDEPELHDLSRSYERQDKTDSRADRQLGINLQRAGQEATLFKQQQDEHKRGQFLGNQIIGSTNEIRQYEATTTQAMAETAKRLGISLDEAGAPVFSNDAIGKSTQRLYLKELEKQGITPQSRTEAINGMLNRYITAPEMQGASVNEIVSGRQQLISSINSLDSLDPTAQGKLKAAQGAIQEQSKIAGSSLKERQQSEAASNPFYNPVKDVEKATSTVMGKLPKDRDFFGFNDKQRKLLEGKVRQALSDGFSQEFVENAFNQVVTEGTFWGDTDENFDDYLKDYGSTEDLANLKKTALPLRTKHAQEQQELEAAALTRQLQLEREYRKANGLTPESPAEVLRRISSGLNRK